MTPDLQKMIIREVVDEISACRQIIAQHGTKPEECARTGTQSCDALEHLTKADSWLSEMEENL